MNHDLAQSKYSQFELGVRWFSDSNLLAELACLIDATPYEYRQEILRESLHFTAEVGCDSDSLQLVYRAQLCECVRERLGAFPSIAAMRQINPELLGVRLKALAEAPDLAQTALALADLVSFVAEQLAAWRLDASQDQDGDDQ